MKIIIEISGGIVRGSYVLGLGKHPRPEVSVVDLDSAMIGETTREEPILVENIQDASDIVIDAACGVDP